MSGIEIHVPSDGDAALRQALLQRVADRLAYARAMDDGVIADDGACCWIKFEWPTKPPYQYPMHRWTHRICRDDCRHWHHQTEVLLGVA